MKGWKQEFANKAVPRLGIKTQSVCSRSQRTAVKKQVLQEWFEKYGVEDRYLIEFLRYLNQNRSRAAFCDQLQAELNGMNDPEQERSHFYRACERKVSELIRGLDQEFQQNCELTPEIWHEMLSNRTHPEIQSAIRMNTDPNGNVNYQRLLDHYRIYNFIKNENWRNWKRKAMSSGNQFFAYHLLRKVMESTPSNSHAAGITPIDQYISDLHSSLAQTKEPVDYGDRYRESALKSIVDGVEPQANGTGWVKFPNNNNSVPNATQLSIVGARLRSCFNAERIASDYLDHNDIHIYFQNYTPVIVLTVNRSGGYLVEAKTQDNDIPDSNHFSMILQHCNQNGIKFKPQFTYDLRFPPVQTGTIDFIPMLSKLKREKPEEYNSLPQQYKDMFEDSVNRLIGSIKSNPSSYFRLYLEVQKMPEIQQLSEVQQLVQQKESEMDASLQNPAQQRGGNMFY